MEQWLKDAVERLNKSGYLKEFSDMARRMCEPFWWSEQEGGSPPSIRGNGTICLVKTDERSFWVTADHMYAAYLRDLEARPKPSPQTAAKLPPKSRVGHPGQVYICIHASPQTRRLQQHPGVAYRRDG